MKGQRSINFVFSANHDGSITRLVAAYANQLASRGWHVFVSYPIVGWWDFHLWTLDRLPLKKSRWLALKYYLLLLRPIIATFVKIAIGKLPWQWYGKLHHNLSEDVHLIRYLIQPSNRSMPDADFTVTMQNYLMPHLLCLSDRCGKPIGAIHSDYVATQEQTDSAQSFRDWWKHVNLLERQLDVPIFCSSKVSMDSAQALGIDTDTVINNGVDLDFFRDSERRGEIRPLNITLYCDPRPVKGAKYGCEAVKRLRAELDGMDISYRCFPGYGPDWAETAPDTYQLFDRDFGYLHGEQLVEMYQSTDIFISPSIFEGFSLALIEAMACGCALVTNMVSGVDEFGEHGVNCMISEPKDVDKMVENIRLLVVDSEMRDRIREQGIEVAQRYSWEILATKLIEFLDRSAEN